MASAGAVRRERRRAARGKLDAVQNDVLSLANVVEQDSAEQDSPEKNNNATDRIKRMNDYLESSEWLKNLKNNLEVYKFVSQHGKRKEEMTPEELEEKKIAVSK